MANGICHILLLLLLLLQPLPLHVVLLHLPQRAVLEFRENRAQVVQQGEADELVEPTLALGHTLCIQRGVGGVRTGG